MEKLWNDYFWSDFFGTPKPYRKVDYKQKRKNRKRNKVARKSRKS